MALPRHIAGALAKPRIAQRNGGIAAVPCSSTTLSTFEKFCQISISRLPTYSYYTVHHYPVCHRYGILSADPECGALLLRKNTDFPYNRTEGRYLFYLPPAHRASKRNPTKHPSSGSWKFIYKPPCHPRHHAPM